MLGYLLAWCLGRSLKTIATRAAFFLLFYCFGFGSSTRTRPPWQGIAWYVRPDGGSRYSAGHTSGQCDGKADTAYGGTGTNQHCSFGDVRWLYDAQDGNPRSWVIAGGETVIIRGGPWL